MSTTTQNKRHLSNRKSPLFPEPIHVGRPNVGDRATFEKMVGEILDRNWLTNNGPLVQTFEKMLEEYLDVEHCVVMCNGTIALEIAVRAADLSGEIIVPSYSFVATAHAIAWQGYTPVFADIDPSTHNICPKSVEQKITEKTSAIVGVHLWGRAAPVDELTKLAEQYRLRLMFDAAHSFGVSYKGQMIGRFGDAEVFSFHATKFFNSFEGGAVTTQDPQLAEAARLMRNFGFAGNDNVIYSGTNGKMPEICAAMGIANLSNLEKVVERNRENYEAYRHYLSELTEIRLLEYPEGESNNFQYIVAELTSDNEELRDWLVAGLEAENILARKYFWPGIHRMMPYREVDPEAALSLAQTELVARNVVVLPTGLAVNPNCVRQICKVIKRLVETS